MGVIEYIKRIFGRGNYEAGYVSQPSWQERHEHAKAVVGNAPFGTPQYEKNAAKVLSQHAGSGMRAETREKLEHLVQSSDPETRRIAQNALRGVRYDVDLDKYGGTSNEYKCPYSED